MKNFATKKKPFPWVQHLFKKSDGGFVASQNKIFFTHRYSETHGVTGRSSYSSLFTDTTPVTVCPSPCPDSFQQLFEQNSRITSGNRLTSDSLPSKESKILSDDSVILDFPDSLTSSQQYTVLNCYDETHDTRTFRLGNANRQRFNYLPGQYITLTVNIQGQVYKRSYSLASSPSRPRTLDLTIKRDSNGGVVSNWLNDHLRIGDTLNFKGPFGKFSCINDAPSKILFIAAGSGIVPIMSMLRWLTDIDASVDIRLLLSFRTPGDIIYRDELDLIAARYKNVTIAITLTTDSIARYQWHGLTGRISESMLIDRVPDLAGRMVYLCGPDSFMASCKTLLLSLNLPPEKLFCESFTVNTPSAKSLPCCDGQPLANKSGNYRVSFTKSGKIISSDGRMTILELAEKSGINIGHECRSGTCGECMVKCLKGKIEMTEQAEIDNVDRNQGWVYSCCSYPTSNIELDV